jgi:hypothetical protein
MDLVNQGTIDLVSKPGHKDQHAYFLNPRPRGWLIISARASHCAQYCVLLTRLMPREKRV